MWVNPCSSQNRVAMHLDVVDLRSFYYRTKLGRSAQRAISDKARGIWPDVSGLTVAAFGFSVPLLRPYLEEAERTLALMPGQQGVMPWPAGQPNMSVLCHETLWPLEAESVDRLLVMHGLETSENPPAVIEECYRTLAPEGRVLFIVPNRAGLWAKNDATPFGFGRPYSLSQLEAQMKFHGFDALGHAAALFQPPSVAPFWMRTGRVWERLGQRLSNSIAGGVLLLEVKKTVPAPPNRGLPEALKKPQRVLDGMTSPVPKPV